MEYGQFCPVAKASEIIGEKWTVLIIRELLMGARRFSELQRGLGTISPTLLTRRLVHLDDCGMLIRRRVQGQKGYEYVPTASCQALLPIILALGDWGMHWARANLTTKDYDVELLMLYLQRSIKREMLPSGETVIRFKFTDMEEKADWWLLVGSNGTDVCDRNPGRDVDVFFTTTVRTMADIWMGEITYRKAMSDEALSVVGPGALVNNVSKWMNNSMFTELPSARKI